MILTKQKDSQTLRTVLVAGGGGSGWEGGIVKEFGMDITHCYVLNG